MVKKSIDKSISISNRKARYEYELLEVFTAGIQLQGTEIKSLRAGNANIAEAYCYVQLSEVWVTGMYIAEYQYASYMNHEPKRLRKLLLNKKEINKLIGKMHRDGFTLVPTKMYFKKGKAKIELAVAKGKKQYDKRATKKSRDWNREKSRYIRKSS